MPLCPSVLRKHSRWSVLKYFSEFFRWHVELGYSYIRRRTVDHQLRQKCFEISQRLLGSVVPNYLSRNPQQFNRIRSHEVHSSIPPGLRPCRGRSSGSLSKSICCADRVRSCCMASGTRSSVPSP